MIAGLDIRVDGSTIDTALDDLIVEVTVEDHLMLPDMFTIRMSDPKLKHIDSHPFRIGADVTIRMAGAKHKEKLVSVIDGQITSVEPSFRKGGATITIRGYDYSHALNRSRRVRTFQNVMAGDVARTIAREAGLEIGEVGQEGGVQEFIQQNNETDWQFLWRLAHRVGAELVVLGKTMHFRASGGGDHPQEIAMRWGEDLLEFRPRLTGVQQIDDVVVTGWDPERKEVIEATAKAEGLMTSIGTKRSAVVGALSGGTLTMASNPVATREEAEALALSMADRVGNAYLEAEGEALGNPHLRAGTPIAIDGLGTSFGGSYTLASSTHVYRGGSGYMTRFAISGRADRSFVQLSTPAAPQGWGAAVSVGIVTQNTDPKGMGRVRVTYPELGKDNEGWWARIASIGSGPEKGCLMMPVVGDEVLVAFEHNDVRRPYILGSVWNGKDKPGELAQADGSLSIRSAKRVTAAAVNEMLLTSDRDITLRVGDATIRISESGEVTINATKIRMEASDTLDISVGGEMHVTAGGNIVLSAPQVIAE